MTSTPPTPPTLWERIPQATRERLVWGLWLVTWLGLLAGFLDRIWFEAVVGFSVAHAVLLLSLNRFDAMRFPVQVRIAYALWVAVGTYVPHMTVFLVITTIGLCGNLFFHYCPLARTLYLLPWNRDEAFTWNLVRRVAITPPRPGRFKPMPRAGESRP